MSNPLSLIERSGAYVYKGALKLPKYAWPGGYDLSYYTEKCDMLCPECATDEYFEWLYALTVNRRDLPFAIGYDDPPTMVDCYWEGPDSYCDNCYKVMPAVYGDPDDDGSSTSLVEATQ